MPVILQGALKLYSSIAGFVLPMCAAALVGLWIAKAIEIRTLTDDGNALRAEIDDPNTGFRTQISAILAKAAGLRANQHTLQASLDEQNAKIEGLRVAADAASQRARDALSKANADSLKSEVRIAALLNAKAGENVCSSAFDLLQMAGVP